MNAWLFQDHRQKQKLGDNCPWSVGWIDPEGRRKSKKIGAKSRAEKYARKIEGQLAAGTYENKSAATWPDFINAYESKVLAGMLPSTRQTTQQALNHFERIIKPIKMRAVTSMTFATYVAARRLESAHRKRKTTDAKTTKKAKVEEPPRLVSPATINCELRSLRAAVRKAEKWGYIPKGKGPEIEFLKEPGKLPVYVTPEHFAKIYASCDATRWPDRQPFTAADWWRGLLVAAYMTGWRIGSLLALRWADVDLDAGTALSRAADNKGKRDQLVPLHPLVVEHLRRLKSFSTFVFPWLHGRRQVYDEFLALQKAAGVHPTGKARYGFHDLRRAFATMNAATLTPDALQALMQHQDYQTTQRYINMARQLNPAVANLYVPTLTVATGG